MENNMALPKIDTPTFILELPSTKEKIKFRPFTVKEEKILLMAAQSEDETDIANAIEQILVNCIISNVNLFEFTTYDVEYVFINLRAKSVNNIIELSFIDEVDEEEYKVSFDIDDVQLKTIERTNIIAINDEISITMIDPTYKVVKDLQAQNLPQDKLVFNMIAKCIDKVLIGDDVLILKDHTQKEQEEFINSLSSKNMRDIENYLESMPKLSHDIVYTRKDGTEITKTLEGMNNFFT